MGGAESAEEGEKAKGMKILGGAWEWEEQRSAEYEICLPLRLARP